MGQERKLGDGVAGWVAEYREALLVGDANAGPAFATEFAAHYSTKSFLSVPLTVQERTLGVLNLTGKTNGESFTEQDRDFVVAIAGQISVAIENAALYDTIQQNCLSAVQVLAESLERATRTRADIRRASPTTRYASQSRSASRIRALRRFGTRAGCTTSGSSESARKSCGRTAAFPKTSGRWSASTRQRASGIIGSLGFLDRVKPIIRHHHECWNGTGYPDGLKGEEIPFLTRILSVADCYDAMTSQRPYRDALSHKQALSELEAGRDRQFDPAVVQEFARVIVTPLHHHTG